jgi:uncharacterized protein YbgA (DUF1722 family)/uncharacterized protein YbbK (DUF523 family)
MGISSCLLGERVRYDGQHKHDPYLTETLGQFFEWVPVCPEVECGLSIPREAMRLVGDPERPRLVTQKTGIDHTERMQAWARKRLRELEPLDLHGYVFKRASPSSGLERVKVYEGSGMPRKVGVGLWARAFTEHFPLLPAEEEGRLHDPVLRENFIERVFALKSFRETVARGRTRANLVEFHARHKLLLMSHSPEKLRELGRLVAHAKELPSTELYERYQVLFLAALAVHATVRKHVNVLQHMLGYFKQQLDAAEKVELLEAIDQYRRELVPLVVPLTLLKHYIRKHGEPYLSTQVYLSPHPVELRLR